MEAKVYIRVDGDEAIGLGHLVRCIALAQMLEKRFSITFVCKKIIISIKEQIEQLGFGLVTINEEEDFIKTLNGDEIVVLDHYGLDCNYQQIIKGKKSKLVCIDDLHDKEFYADLIINHAPGIIERDYTAQNYSAFALGPDYSLLRPKFLEHARTERNIKEIRTLFVCFGGSDSKNLTAQILEIASHFTDFSKIIVVTGAAYKNHDDLKHYCDLNNKIFYYHNIKEDRMLSLMLESDLAIVPSSGILLEAIATGCRIISGMYVNNQKELYEKYKAAGFFKDAGNFNAASTEKAIIESLTDIKPRKKIIDGKSGFRILKKFEYLVYKDKVKLFIANDTHIDVTYHWASNPHVRMFSFNTNTITKEEHQKWFLSKLSDVNCYYFIAMYCATPIGSIRFDVKDSEAVISYLVDPAFHGRGFGLILLQAGYNELTMIDKKLNLGIKTISGYVLKENIPSIKAFEQLQYEKEDEGLQFKFIKAIQ
jgi:UDP-2,4-diacetamido-2,4,6-trideoxy-beta-L-altropyranose hydrolase